jgi:hypothetical protein
LANSISTTGTTNDPASTKHQNGESVQSWVTRHDKKVGDATPSGNSLTTSWPCASGTETVTTNRNAGETDAAFQARHITDYLLQMLDCPPVP